MVGDVGDGAFEMVGEAVVIFMFGTMFFSRWKQVDILSLFIYKMMIVIITIMMMIIIISNNNIHTACFT